MNVQTLIESGTFIELSEGKKERSIEGVQCCDLLSWVMANGKANQIWITVQTHVNIVAVATLLDFSCVVIPEGIPVDEAVCKKASEEGLILLGTDKNSYEIFSWLYENGLRP